MHNWCWSFEMNGKFAKETTNIKFKVSTKTKRNLISEIKKLAQVWLNPQIIFGQGFLSFKGSLPRMIRKIMLFSLWNENIPWW